MSTTPPNIPGFIEGQYAEIPPDSYPQAIQNGFKPGVTLTSPEGRKAVVPGDQAGKAIKEQGFALGPPEQQPKTKMFSPVGDYAEVPNNAVQFGLKNGWKQAIDATSPLGHSVPLPPDLAETAKKVGWGMGAPDTQPKPGFFASAVGSMMGVNRDDIARSRFENSALGQRAKAIQDQRLALNPRDTTDPRQDRLQAAKDLGIDPAHLQKLDDLEAKAEKGVPWEDQLAEKFPVIGSQVRAAVKAVKPTKPGQPPVSGVERAGHGLAAALPFVGPMAEGSGEALGQGDIKSAAGQAAFAALPFLTHAAPEVAPRSEPTVTPTLTLGERAKTAGVRLLSGGNTGQERPLEPAAGPGTHAEVADYAASKGIELTPAQATQSKPLKAIQAVGERAVVGGKPLQDVLTRQHGQVANAVSELQDRVGNPYTPDAEAVGEHLQSQANEKLQALKDKAQADYQDFKEKTGGQGFDVDLSPVVDKYKTELQKQGEVLKNVPEQFAAPIRNMLEKLSNIKSDLPKPEANPVVRMDTAQQLRSYYLEIARDKSGNIPSRVNRLAAQAAQDIDEAMEKSAGPNADTWRRANATWKQLQETYNDKASPLTKLISEPDTQKITASLLAKGRFGGNSKTIRTLSQNGYDLSPLRHQVISDIASQNFKLTNGGNGLGGYQLPFLKELFEPQDLTELLHLGRVARATKFELNPSGTSNVLEALQQMGSVAKSKSPSLLGAGAGFALGGPVGAAIGAGSAEGLVPAAAARFSANPRNLQRALGRPVLEGRELERGSTTPEDLDEALRAQFQKTSARDTDFSTQARNELFPGRNPEQLTPPEMSQVMQRAQELKTRIPDQFLKQAADNFAKSSDIDQNAIIDFLESFKEGEERNRVEGFLNDALNKDISVQEGGIRLEPTAAKPRGLGHYSPEDQARVQALPEFLRQVEPRQLTPEEEKLAYGQARVSQLKQQLREATDPAEREALQRQLDFVQGQRGSASPEDITKANPVFYSKLEQLAQEKLPARFTGDQALATLRNAGVKADELAMVEPLLKGSTVLSKSAFMDEVRKNNLASQVQDVWKRDTSEGEPGSSAGLGRPTDEHLWDKSYDKAMDAWDGSAYYEKHAQRLFGRSYDELRAEDDAGSALTEPEKAKLDKWARLDYSERQRLGVQPEYEKLLSKGSERVEKVDEAVHDDPEALAEIENIAHEFYQDRDGEYEPEGGPRYAEHQLPGGENYRELLLQLHQHDPVLLEKEAQRNYSKSYNDLNQQQKSILNNQIADNENPFSSSHWDEPNVLGHLRMNDRTDVNGKKTLFLEELQSDWHQQGRNQGYQGDETALSRSSVHGGTEQRVPDAPFKKDWHELLLKRALREAAEGGYDQLAWTPGDVQNERYDLSKHVSSIEYFKDKDGNYHLDAVPIGNAQRITQGPVPPEKLENYVGKDVAQKIVNGDGKALSTERQLRPGIVRKELSGLDLKLGGQGMRGFYDKLVPDFLNRYGKRWGVKVGSTEIPSSKPIDQLGYIKNKDGTYSLDIQYQDGTQEGKDDLSLNEIREQLGKGPADLISMGRGKPFKEPAQSNSPWSYIDLRGSSSMGINRKVPVITITPKMRQDIMKGQPISDLMPPKNQPRLPMQNVVSPRSEAQLPWA